MKRFSIVAALLFFFLSACQTQSAVQIPSEVGPEIGATPNGRKYSFSASRVVQKGVAPSVAVFSGTLKSDDFPQKPSAHFQFEAELTNCKVLSGSDGEYFLIVPMIAR